jgi:hypothetical protein
MSAAWIALLPNKKQKIWKKQHHHMIFDYARVFTVHTCRCRWMTLSRARLLRYRHDIAHEQQTHQLSLYLV